MDTKDLRNFFAKTIKERQLFRNVQNLLKSILIYSVRLSLCIEQEWSRWNNSYFSKWKFFHSPQHRASRVFWFLLDERKCTNLTYQALILTFCSEVHKTQTELKRVRVHFRLSQSSCFLGSELSKNEEGFYQTNGILPQVWNHV